MKLWSDEATLLLISLVKKYNDQLERGIKKYVWQKISTEIFQQLKKKFTVTQIETKWKSLVRHYKNIVNSNSTSGNSRKDWQFYNAIHEVIYKKPEINPVATCDNHSGLKVKTHDGLVLTTTINAGPGKSEENTDSEFETSFSRKRKNREAGVSKRHAEKMQRLDRLQNTLDRMVDLMAIKYAKDVTN